MDCGAYHGEGPVVSLTEEVIQQSGVTCRALFGRIMHQQSLFQDLVEEKHHARRVGTGHGHDASTMGQKGLKSILEFVRKKKKQRLVVNNAAVTDSTVSRQPRIEVQ